MKVVDEITNCLITKVLNQGGQVLAFNQTDSFNVKSAEDDQITIESQGYQFQVGDKISLIYLPKYTSPYCTGYSDADGDGIIDIVDKDADGDGVIDPYIPFAPTILFATALYKPADGITIIGVDTSPNKIARIKAREWGKPITIDGYYPLYITEPEALWASPMATPEAHPHEMSEEHDGEIHRWEYWMPHGVNQFHGDYAKCKPHLVEELLVSSVETYDWEYVDRTILNNEFSSIVPYDYVNRVLGVDTDENGTFDAETNYNLNEIFNVKDVLDQNGNVLESGDFKSAHYATSPQQVWTFEVVSKDTSENALPDGHSFQFNNFAFYLQTYTKFDVGTQDAIDHTASKFGYYSKGANGNNATLQSSNSAVIIYNDNGVWRKREILEINSEGFIITQFDDYNVGDRFYIYLEEFPDAPSIISIEVTNPANAPTNVVATKLPERPNELLTVSARLLPIPDAPSFVEVSVGVEEQEIIWDQFE